MSSFCEMARQLLLLVTVLCAAAGLEITGAPSTRSFSSNKLVILPVKSDHSVECGVKTIREIEKYCVVEFDVVRNDLGNRVKKSVKENKNATTPLSGTRKPSNWHLVR